MRTELWSDNPQRQVAGMRRAAPSSKNLPLVEEQAASEEVRALFAQYREQFGRADLPGIVLYFATSPGLLRGMLHIAGGLLFCESLLSRRHKEMIATYLSQQNACAYCTDSHAALLAVQGGSAELICNLQDRELNAGVLTDAEVALLRFTEKVNTDSSALIRDDVEALIEAGWTESQIAEAVHIAALFAAFNRIANGFGLPSPYPEGLREQL